MKNKCGVPTLPPISTLHFEASHEAIFRNLRDEAHGAPPASNWTINRNNRIWEVPEEEFDTVIDTNVKGTANVMRQFIPLMIENKQGIIVNMSSGWGRSAAAQVAPYCASKWAVEGLSRSVAKELPSGLAIVALNPGVINTDMLMSCFGGSAALYQTPEAWAPKAASMILNLTAADNGASLTV
ncbi:NADPH-dependent pterin aldehyde reductase [Vitis vinifera]|uniref:NADPH-dependent pterin aldehyde reductase n=1 Tax=Vitis vinifera TaxID=29760 RepID=A0A438JA56_VITVI|nr:NADPH-dependent pterin aldehyde reductase [Vitis vinifera]